MKPSIYIVIATHGEYEDRDWRVVGYFENKADAYDYAAKAHEASREVCDRRETILRAGSGMVVATMSDAEYADWEKRDAKASRLKSKVDKGLHHYHFGDVYYHVERVGKL